MKIDILASGSQGNCIALTSKGKTILIDAGIAKTKIERALLAVGIRADQVSAIFITHSHGDHIKGLPFADKYRIPVFAAPEEWQNIKNVDDPLKKTVHEGSLTWTEQFTVSPFNVHHDALQPLGYVVEAKPDICSICLDTGKVDEQMLLKMSGSNIFIMEANHEPNLLEESDYPNSVKARVLSHIGHLSNEQTAEALSKLIQGRNEQIYLTHLSRSNNFPALAEATVVRRLKQAGYKKGKHYGIEVI